VGTVFNVIFSASFGYAVLRVTTPILFAALAAIISDRAGVINISLEGTMLISALIGVLVSAFTQSASLGLFAAVIAGILVAFILAYCSLNLKVDIILTGIAINMFASGGTVFLLYLITKDKGMSGSLKSMVLPNLNIPFLKDIPILGPILSGHNILTYLAFLSVLVVYIFLYKTTLGLRIRATGEYPSAIESIGISPKRVQYIALMISGMLSGFGGAFMSMGYVSWFSRDMVAGRGFIALAAEAMGRGNPLGTLVASLVFGGADALSNSLQTLQMPAEFVMMIPYLTTIIGITIYSIQKASKNK
jgi:simple sugar transport system permease protein